MNMLQYSIHFGGFLMLVGLRLMPNVLQGAEVIVDIMLLLIANNC
jgi:hypothetical protein